MSAIEPTTTVEQDGFNVRVTQDWTSVLDKMARDVADRIDEATLARLGYVKRGTCKLERADWDDGTCTWGCICTACDAHLEHETGIGYSYCPICGAKVVVE